MLTTFPALRRVSLISLASFLWEKNGVEQIVWPRPPHGDPVTLKEEIFDSDGVRERFLDMAPAFVLNFTELHIVLLPLYEWQKR